MGVGGWGEGMERSGKRSLGLEEDRVGNYLGEGSSKECVSAFFPLLMI